jgi:HSP20 family protein
MKIFTPPSAPEMDKTIYNPLVDLFGNDFMSCSEDNPATIPFIHIKEEKHIYKIEVSLPGFDKKDFNIYVEGNVLVISCRKGDEAGTANRRAFSRGTANYSYFSRFLSLPANIDSDRISAKYNGVLNLIIPKKIRKRRNRKVKYKK